MSTNCVIPTPSKLLFLLFILVSFSFLPVQSGAQTTQAAAASVVASDDNETVNVKVEKLREKENIEITSSFFISLLIDLVAILLIIITIYHPNYKKMDTIFTFVLFNVVIFLLTFVLNKVKMSMGAAFGLFAVFSMLRYRTEGIGIKDMTYLFIFVALGLLSGIQMDPFELAIICGIIFVVTLLLDTNLILKKEFSKQVKYEKIEMVKPDKREELIAELIDRTGLQVHRVVVDQMDYLRDVADITIFYYE
jgi:hypothetical protein